MVKKLLVYLLLLIGINSQAQYELIGQSVNSLKDKDSIIYVSQDTVVIIEHDIVVNYICRSDTINHIIKVLETELLNVVQEGFKTMIKSKDKYYFDGEDSIYYMYLMDLSSKEFFGLYIGRLE